MEKEKYIPQPIDTNGVALPDELILFGYTEADNEVGL